MSEEMDYIDQVQEKPRPTFLKVLCILSFISIGLSGLVSIGSTMVGPQSQEAMLEARAKLYEGTEEMRSTGMGDFADLMEQMRRMNESLNASFYTVAIVNFLILIIGYLGVKNMWDGKRIGFHLYIVYNLMSIGNLYLFVSPADIPTFAVIWGLLLSGIFILLYSRNLHWMTK